MVLRHVQPVTCLHPWARVAARYRFPAPDTFGRSLSQSTLSRKSPSVLFLQFPLSLQLGSSCIFRVLGSASDPALLPALRLVLLLFLCLLSWSLSFGLRRNRLLPARLQVLVLVIHQQAHSLLLYFSAHPYSKSDRFPPPPRRLFQLPALIVTHYSTVSAASLPIFSTSRVINTSSWSVKPHTSSSQ